MTTHSRNWLKFIALISTTFLLGVFFSGIFDIPSLGLAQERHPLDEAEVIAPVQAPKVPEARSLSDLSDAFAAITDAVRPSVVFIQAWGTERQRLGGLPNGFRLPPGFQLETPDDGRGQIVQTTSSGSGFIVSSDGYILTNQHVVEGADRLKVRLLDDRVFDATVVGSDKSTDVAVLKIDVTGLSPAALGTSDKVRVGEWVLAIGNPLGDNLTFSVTQGIVSAKGRGIPPQDSSQTRNIQDFIQTDAAINRGNSGGPLLNVRGEVIGINSAIASTTGSYQGYAFAIPIDLAKVVMRQIISHGRFERALLQISVTDADAEDAAYLGLPSITGVRVAAFPETGSPAKDAGLVPGDVIIAIDDKPVKYTAQLQQLVGFHRPGDQIKVTVARKGGTTRDFMIRSVGDTEPAAEQKPTTEPASNKDSGAPSAPTNRLGVTVDPLTPAQAQEIRVKHGVLVKGTIRGSSANDKLGGRVITEIEGKAIRNEEDLRAALKEAHNDIVTVTVVDGAGTPTTLRVRLLPK